MSAQLRLNDDGISRRHCRVLSIGGRVIIEDLGSANGTLVNGEMVQHQELKEGDKIRLGATTMLKFTYQDKLDETFQQQMYDAALRDGLTKRLQQEVLPSTGSRPSSPTRSGTRRCCRSSCSTSTTSRRSTTPTATSPATPCSCTSRASRSR